MSLCYLQHAQVPQHAFRLKLLTFFLSLPYIFCVVFRLDLYLRWSPHPSDLTITHVPVLWLVLRNRYTYTSFTNYNACRFTRIPHFAPYTPFIQHYCNLRSLARVHDMTSTFRPIQCIYVFYTWYCGYTRTLLFPFSLSSNTNTRPGPSACF